MDAGKETKHSKWKEKVLNWAVYSLLCCGFGSWFLLVQKMSRKIPLLNNTRLIFSASSVTLQWWLAFRALPVKIISLEMCPGKFSSLISSWRALHGLLLCFWEYVVCNGKRKSSFVLRRGQADRKMIIIIARGQNQFEIVTRSLFTSVVSSKVNEAALYSEKKWQNSTTEKQTSYTWTWKDLLLGLIVSSTFEISSNNPNPKGSLWNDTPH